MTCYCQVLWVLSDYRFTASDVHNTTLLASPKGSSSLGDLVGLPRTWGTRLPPHLGTLASMKLYMLLCNVEALRNLRDRCCLARLHQDNLRCFALAMCLSLYVCAAIMRKPLACAMSISLGVGRFTANYLELLIEAASVRHYTSSYRKSTLTLQLPHVARKPSKSTSQSLLEAIALVKLFVGGCIGNLDKDQMQSARERSQILIRNLWLQEKLPRWHQHLSILLSLIG